MSIQLAGDLAGTRIANVDSQYLALRTGSFPIDGNHYSFQTSSGAMTGIATNNPVFSFRNISTNQILIQEVSITAIATTGFTAAQRIGFQLWVARNWTVSDSGGTAVPLTGNTNKLRTSYTTLTAVDCRISTTGALTAGTRTADTYPIDSNYGWAAAATAGIVIPHTNIYASFENGHPLVLGQNEGIVLVTGAAFGAAGVVTLDVTVKLIERTTY